jgi:hypothetical protein
VKRYQGKTSTSVWIDGKGSFDAEFPGHDVQYLGTLAAHGDELAGHWSIPASDTRPELRGRFRLRRARDAAR